MGTGTTTFVNGALFEVATTEAGAVTAWRHYIDSPEGVIGVVMRYPAQATTTRYWHKDHLGSMVAETDAGGANVERFAYDAWGKRRLATQLPGDPTNLALASSQRGFTGHEHLDEVGIVHMNGRLYHPVTGHFLQADPVIQEPLEAQSDNRYGYVLNNPLSYTDPGGPARRGPDYVMRQERMRSAACAAPKPLSMLTTARPDAQLASAAASAVCPPAPTP